MPYSITIPNPPDKNVWDELKSNQKQCYPVMNKEFFLQKMSVEIEDTWNFFIPLFPGYREKISNKEIPDYKSSKNPG